MDGRLIIKIAHRKLKMMIWTHKRSRVCVCVGCWCKNLHVDGREEMNNSSFSQLSISDVVHLHCTHTQTMRRIVRKTGMVR